MKSILIFCFCVCFIASSAQNKNSFYALDAKMNQTVLDSSKYILWIHEIADNNWQWDYYYTWGPLVKSQSFADHDGSMLNGRSSLYNKTGNLDSTGIYDHGKKNGTFFKYHTYSKDSMRVVMQYDYMQDSLVKTKDLTKDSANNKFTDTSSKESEFPGGLAKWNDYLQHTLKYPERAINKEIQGQVKIIFVVDTDGKIKDPYIYRSVEYSLDQESLRVISNSGNWNPAFQDGVNKKSYKIMPINFRLE